MALGMMTSLSSVEMPFSRNVHPQEPRHFSWVIVGEVAASAYPSTIEQLAWC